MIPSTWTDHEEFLAATPATRVKLLRYDHLQAIWKCAPFGPPPFSLDEALSRLDWAIERYSLNLCPPLKPFGPVFSVSPGQPYPDDLRPHSEFIRRRWPKITVPTTVFAASRRAASTFGGSSHGVGPHEQWNHDVLLADAFVHHLCTNPANIHEWVGEQLMDKNGQRCVKDPDAFLCRSDGTPYKVIESGGSYSANHLAELCEYATERELYLEVW